MQSIAPVLDADPSWKNPMFYAWILVIGAIIYTGIAYKDLNLVNPIGLFVGLAVYYVFVKVWYSASIEFISSPVGGHSGLALLFNALLTIAIFVSLCALFGGTLYVFFIPIYVFIAVYYLYKHYQSGFTRVVFTQGTLNANYFALSILFPINIIIGKINEATAIYNKAVEDATAKKDKESVPSPLGYEIVVGSAVAIFALALIAFRWNYDDLMQKSTAEIAISSLTNFLTTFPLLQYFKYVVDNDYMDVAKRVIVVALMAYVAYLIFSVYVNKNALSLCADTSFASCFDYPQKSSTPCINVLVWVLIYCSIINAVNWITKTFGTARISTWFSGQAQAQAQAQENPPTDVGTLVKLLFFPFYWIFTMFAQNPVATIISTVAFAVLGLMLYRSSFDLTSFIEGQRGTVVTLFTLFIVSLVVFGVYAMHSTTTAMAQGAMSYGQFIAKTGMVIAVTVCAVGLLLYCLNSHSKLATVANITQYGITAMIYIAGIAIAIGLARTVFSTSRKMGGSMFQVSPESNWVINVLKLIANAMFYLPCLMLDTVDMLKEQYGLTTRPILILLAMEAAFILAGHLLPSAVVKALNHTGVHILSAPISMTNHTSTANEIHFVDVNAADPTPTDTSQPGTVLLHNYNYGVSAWFYIHPQPPNTNSNYDATTYLNMVQVGEAFGPVVKYNPKLNAMQFSIYGIPIESADIPNSPFTITDIPLQTWNNVVINSDKGVVDIFINNKLMYTGTHLPKINSQDRFTISTGQDDGIHGEICNIMLNTTPFTKTEIGWLYKTNKALNPPIVGADQPTPESDDANAPDGESGMKTFSIVGAVFGAIFGWLFNDEAHALKGLVMGAIVFGLIGTLLGNLFSADGTIAYIFKTGANVFVDTF